jgi:hypothetical protein
MGFDLDFCQPLRPTTLRLPISRLEPFEQRNYFVEYISLASKILKSSVNVHYLSKAIAESRLGFSRAITIPSA